MTCILCKQMEHILARNIMKHLNSNHLDLLYSKQHWFCSKLSCETQLFEYTSDALKTAWDKKQCYVAVMDFSKAVDKVSHDSLICKLNRASIDKQTRNWMKSFLSGQSQKVVIDGEESENLCQSPAGYSQNQSLSRFSSKSLLMICHRTQNTPRYANLPMTRSFISLFLPQMAVKSCRMI